MEYMKRVINQLYQNTPWLLEERPKGDRAAKKLNLFGVTGTAKDSDDDDKPANHGTGVAARNPRRSPFQTRSSKTRRSMGSVPSATSTTPSKESLESRPATRLLTALSTTL